MNRKGWPWWLVSLIAAVAAMAVFGFAIFLPVWPAGIILAVGVLVFIIVIHHNPAYWHRRMAEMSLGIGATSAFAPTIKTAFQVAPDAFGSLLIDNGAAYPVGIFAIAAAVAFGTLDYLLRRRSRTATDCPGHPGNEQTLTGNGSSAAIARDSGRAMAVSVGPGAIVVPGDNSSVSINDVNPLLDRIEKLTGEKLVLGQRLQVSEQEKASLAAALARVEKRAEQGDPQAKAAIREARASGDTAKLQETLKAEQARREGEIRKDAADYFELCRELAAVAYLRGDIDEARKQLETILRFFPDDLDAINRMGEICVLRGELASAEGYYRRCLELAPNDDECKAIVYGNLGHIYQIRDNPDEAEKLLRESLQINEKLGRQEGMAAVYGNLGLICWMRGKPDEAEKMFRKSLQINEKLGRQKGMAMQYCNLGVICQMRGDLDEAEKMFRKSLEIDEKLGRLEGMAAAYGNLGLVHKLRGELGNAEEMHRKALAINERLGRLEGMANQYGNLGLIYRTRGDLDKAEEMHRKSLAINEKLGRLEGMAIQYDNLGSVEKQQGRLVEAKELWTKAVELYKRIGMPHMVKKVQGWIDGLEGGEEKGGTRA